jgi:hypothetical protein
VTFEPRPSTRAGALWAAHAFFRVRLGDGSSGGKRLPRLYGNDQD